MPASRAGRGFLAATALICHTLLLSGCSKPELIALLPNQRPTIEVTQAPVHSDQPFFYGYELRWAGFDEDGRVDHFRYAVDPPTRADAETAWVSTRDNRRSFLFRSDEVDTLTDKTAEGLHTIVLEAVDERGAVSAPVTRSLTSFTIAPTVQIIQPVPNHLFSPMFGPSFRLGWRGEDPDGRGTNRPVQYKYKLFPEDGQEFDFLTVLVNPDSLRRRYAPRFSNWDSVGGDTTAVNFRDMAPNKKYVAVVVAFDEVGAYSPVMNLDVNMLYFTVGYAGLLGPKFTVFNESFFYTFPSGGFSLDPATFVRTEAAAGRPIRFNWFATTNAASYVAGYRWMLDGDVNDEREREDEQAQTNRWSRWGAQTTGVELPAFDPAGISESHTLYIEAEDNMGLVSLAVIQFTVVKAIFDKELLIVDDTRFLGDRPLPGGCVDRPRGVWPTAAEFDTFLFARGGVPWKCYPAGTVSQPGLFKGYAYDTLGTRFLAKGTLSLSQLSRYKHVIWYTDSKAARNVNEPNLSVDPMSMLRWLTYPGRTNPIGTWVSQGGQLWMFGGGAATALQVNSEKAGTPGDVFSSADGELVPGRFMYDVFGWRSEIQVKSIVQAQKPPHAINRGSGTLDYSGLPDYLLEKSPASDPFATYAPNRTNQSDFYQGAHLAEGITKANDVTEDVDPSPGVVQLASVVDTVYESVGGQLGASRPVMTVWHGGRDGKLQIFSGFQLWYWRREHQLQIVDWVLQTAWGLPRENVPR